MMTKRVRILLWTLGAAEGEPAVEGRHRCAAPLRSVLKTQAEQIVLQFFFRITNGSPHSLHLLVSAFLFIIPRYWVLPNGLGYDTILEGKVIALLA